MNDRSLTHILEDMEQLMLSNDAQIRLELTALKDRDLIAIWQQSAGETYRQQLARDEMGRRGLHS